MQPEDITLEVRGNVQGEIILSQINETWLATKKQCSCRYPYISLIVTKDWLTLYTLEFDILNEPIRLRPQAVVQYLRQ